MTRLLIITAAAVAAAVLIAIYARGAMRWKSAPAAAGLAAAALACMLCVFASNRETAAVIAETLVQTTGDPRETAARFSSAWRRGHRLQ